MAKKRRIIITSFPIAQETIDGLVEQAVEQGAPNTEYEISPELAAQLRAEQAKWAGYRAFIDGYEARKAAMLAREIAKLVLPPTPTPTPTPTPPPKSKQKRSAKQRDRIVEALREIYPPNGAVPELIRRNVTAKEINKILKAHPAHPKTIAKVVDELRAKNSHQVISTT